jgi:hypothetical protein
MSRSVQFWLVSVTLLAQACSGGGESTGSRAKKDGLQTSNNNQNGSGDAGGSILPVGDCNQQWQLALKQQPKGAVFKYQEQISKLSVNAERTDTITASSDQGITRSIVINDQTLAAFAGNLANQTVTITKDLFLKGCADNGGQPGAVAILGGTVKYGAPVSESLSIGGKQLAVKKYTGTATNLSYGGMIINADVVAYMSPQYPAFPLKQIITVKSDNSLINGAVITDLFSGTLP